jgi:hypothetical protein
MQLRIGDMFDTKFDLYCATTNSELNNRNALIMGAGSAKSVKLRYPGIEQQFGELIDKQRNKHYKYGLIVVDYEGQLVGAFQTKTSYKYASDPILIKQSVDMLVSWCNANPTKTVALPYPGIGYGGLTISEVEKIIAPLPDTVTLFLISVREGVRFSDGNEHYVVVRKHLGNRWVVYSRYNQEYLMTETEIINYINNPQQVEVAAYSN